MTKQYKRPAVDEQRYKQVMIAAAMRGTTVKRWIDEAINEKLEREKAVPKAMDEGDE